MLLPFQKLADKHKDRQVDRTGDTWHCMNTFQEFLRGRGNQFSNVISIHTKFNLRKFSFVLLRLVVSDDLYYLCYRVIKVSLFKYVPLDGNREIVEALTQN